MDGAGMHRVNTSRGNNKEDWAEQLKKGETFESWEELKTFIIGHGVQCERIIKSYKKDKTRCLANCKMNSPEVEIMKRCPWRIRALEKKKNKIITITKSNLNHTCEVADHWKRRMHTNSDHLAQKIIDIVMKNRQTRASSLRDTAQALIHPDIKYYTAYSAKKRALEMLDGKEKDSFYLIPEHYKHILERDLGATAKYAAPDGRFEMLFVCPSAARAAFKHCRPLVAFDGTHTRSAYPQILLIATGMDANNTVIMSAYCMVPTENPTYWLKFLRILRDAIPNMERPGTVFISDREKGLLDGVEEIFPQGFHAFCSWHLGDNCRTKFNKKAKKEFEPLVYAVTPAQFERRMDRIKEKNPDLADYIKKTANPIHYSRAFCPVKRWGHETSQHAESLNRALKPQRMEVAFKQSNLLWDYMMTKFYDKMKLAEFVSTPFPPKIMNILKQTEEKAMLMIADASSDVECRVTDSLGRHFVVTFEPTWKCSCGDWQDIELPCVHAWRACTRLHKRQFDYVSPFYSTAYFKQTYAVPIPVILNDDLLPNYDCGEPLVKRKRGRPSEKARQRFPDEDPVRRPRKCSHCKSIDHDKRKCPLRDAMLSQARGRGPTIESEDEDSVETDEDMLGETSQQKSPCGSDSDDFDEDSSLDAIALRKASYLSDDEEVGEQQETQVVLDVGLSQPGFESEPGFYSQLLASVNNK